MTVYLLVLGDGVEELGVQLGVVLGQGLMAVVVDELHHRHKSERLGEAIFALSVVDLYQFVVSPFPGETRDGQRAIEREFHYIIHANNVKV